MTDVRYETVAEHDAFVGQPAAPASFVGLLPTPSTPGYTYFTDYLGHRWTCCTCLRAWLETFQQWCIFKGYIKNGLDIAQLTGDASASAGTHSQGGVFDLVAEIDDRFVLGARDHGATASWRRYKTQGFWADHLHGCLRGCPHLAASAVAQVKEELYGPPTGVAPRRGGDGLVGTTADPHRDPSPYMNWDAGITAMKKEMGLLALATTTTLVLGAQPMSKGSYAPTSARTVQSGTTYAQGSHVYEYLPNGSTTWATFKTLPVVNGASSFVWNYGGPAPIRVRFVPKDALASKASTSLQVHPNVVDVPALQGQVSTLTTSNTSLTAQVADLQAKLAACQAAQPPNPPKPVPGYGVDVSGWQTVDQVRALAADPANIFGIVKSSEGKTMRSSLFVDQVAAWGAKFLGLYHYTGTPGNTVQEEVDWFLGIAGDIAKSHRSFLDVETAVTPTFVLGWLDAIKAASGIPPIWYTNWKWLPPLRTAATIDEWNRLCDYGLWFAEVASPGKTTPIDPKPGTTRTPTIVLHQYAYTPDGTGNEIDRDWTSDLNKLKVG